MDKEVCRGKLNELWEGAREEMLRVMTEAKTGNIISGTEWTVRDIYQKLARGSFELMVQARVDEVEQAPQGAVPPSGPCGIGSDARGRPPQVRLAPATGDHHQR